MSRRGIRVKRRQFELLARVLKVWYEEHNKEVPHDAYVLLVACLADVCELFVGFERDEFVNTCDSHEGAENA